MRVLILGLGQYPHGSGVEAAAFFAERGDEVVVTDLKTRAELGTNVERLEKYPNVSFVLGEHRLKDVRAADIVVPNPRVRADSVYMQAAVRWGKRIESDITLFLARCPATVIGVTGTRGKSTTTTLIAEMLKASGRSVWIGGNILVSPLTFLERVTATDWVVLELSSWQLELTGRAGVAPAYAVWTNLMRDHLNTYASLDEYAEAKAQIFRQQKPGDVVFLPATRMFDGYAATAPGTVVRVGGARDPARVLVLSTKMKIQGEHNQDNAIMAAAVAQKLGLKDAAIRRALRTFSGLPYRQQKITTRQGVEYINDSTATTPEATMAAIKARVESEKSQIHLIFGGNDKELEFDEVAYMIKNRRVKTYLLPGTAREKIVASFKKVRLTWHDVDDLAEAVRLTKSQAKHGDVILLSPGCTSFGQFKNEFDRGEAFNKLL